jgi:two-component system, chemotaxis family, CheB/CheR fusion protein
MGHGSEETTRALADADVARGRLAAIVESTDDAVMSLSGDGTITSWNPGAERLYGYEAAEIVGQPIFAVIPAVRQGNARAYLARVWDGEHLAHLEGVGRRKDGSEMALSLGLAPIRAAAGQIIGIASIARDVTEHKQVEEALRRRERQLADAQETAHIGSFEWDVASNQLTWSDELCRIYGVVPRQFGATFEAFLERIHPADREPTEAAITAAYRSGQPFEIEERVVRPDGSIRYLHSRGGTVLDAAGRPQRVVGVCQDVTERKEAEAKARQLVHEQAARAAAESAVRERDTFLSVAAHELKTPITSLRGYAQLMLRQLDREGELDAERLRRALQVLDQLSDRLARLIGQLLDLSRLEAGKLPLQCETVDLAGLVRGVVATAQGCAEGHPFQVDVRGSCPALVDPLRLEQVVANLVENAVKYSPEGGAVAITLTRPEPGEVSLTVRDWGLGVAPEHRAYIFDRFHQAHDGQFGGMGLGLYISRQIVELHGGRLEAEFPPDGGTCFVVRLPTEGPVSERRPGPIAEGQGEPGRSDGDTPSSRPAQPQETPSPPRRSAGS